MVPKVHHIKVDCFHVEDEVLENWKLRGHLKETAVVLPSIPVLSNVFYHSPTAW